MARPIKEGLDYFPLDTDIIHDIKIRKIMRSNGPQSIAVLLDLLGNIYGDHGYYMKWDDDVRFLVADDVGISEAAVDELISKAIQVNFFDETLFKKYSILTSKGIQSRYQKASKRKAGYCIQKPYNLIVNVDNNPVNAYKNPSSSEVIDAESTRKKRKVKETKENKNKLNPDDLRLEFTDQFWTKYPKTQGRFFENAFTEFQKALADTPGQKIFDGVERYAKFIKAMNWGKGYISNPDNWLKKRDWEDDWDPKSYESNKKTAGITTDYDPDDNFKDSDIPF